MRIDHYTSKNTNMKIAIDQFFFPGLIMFLTPVVLQKQSIQKNSFTEIPVECKQVSQDNPLIGSWSLSLQAFDENDNGKLDDEERKKGNTNKHFYQFKTDGTCLIHTLKLKGYYELKEEGGKKRLYTYIDEDGKKTPENKWYVISIGKTEMILLSQDKYAFWIFKKV